MRITEPNYDVVWEIRINLIFMAFIEAKKRAPDSEVILSDGTRHTLSDFWKEKPLFLVFLRHFG